METKLQILNSKKKLVDKSWTSFTFLKNFPLKVFMISPQVRSHGYGLLLLSLPSDYVFQSSDRGVALQGDKHN